MMTPANNRHRWLHSLVGTWEFEAECAPTPGGPVEKGTGRETVRALGDYWIIAESRNRMAGCDEMTAVLTVGYDNPRERFIGSWICSAMSTMFVYEGELDPEERMLPLRTTGPNPMDSMKPATFQDVIELQDRDNRLFWSAMLGEDGTWRRFMTARYRRVAD
ncbi:MAG: DUF1579 domain-containing protein [Phycisphaerales bacterium]